MTNHPLLFGVLLLLPIGVLVNMLIFDRVRQYRGVAVVSGLALAACLLAEGLLIAA